jgi:GGDEF domain-containing protein
VNGGLLSPIIIQLKIIQEDVNYGKNYRDLAPISACIGITAIHANDMPEDVLKRADNAMYFVKRNGKGGSINHQELIHIDV